MDLKCYDNAYDWMTENFYRWVWCGLSEDKVRGINVKLAYIQNAEWRDGFEVLWYCVWSV